MLATLGILCVAAKEVQAHEFHGYHHRYGYYAGYCAPIVVSRPVWARPVVVAPLTVYPRVVYPRVYSYPYYYSVPSSGFYYQGPGLSIGVGF
jgi:hypothetical protein